MKKSPQLSKADCYDSIDSLPVMLWWEINDKKDVSLLLKKGCRLITEAESNFLFSLWTDIYNQYVLAFGFGEKLQEKFELEREVIKLIDRKINHNDDGAQTFIDIYQEKLKGMEEVAESTAGNNLFKTTVRLEKIIGFSIDLEKTSVRKYYSYLEFIKEQAENGNR